MAEYVAVEGRVLADLHNLGTAEVVGIVSRLDQTLEQHPAAVVGIRRVLVEVRVLAVGLAVGMGRRVAAEGRRLLVVRNTIQTNILVVATGGEVAGDKRCIRAAHNRAGSNRMVEGR